MMKHIVIAVCLLMAPTSMSSQEIRLAQKTQPFDPRLRVATFDSMAPRFSRDSLSTWPSAWRDPLPTARGLTGQAENLSQTQGQAVKKRSSRRKWPYLFSGGIMVGVGIPLTQMSWNGCQPRIYDGCSFHQGRGGRAVGIAALAGGGALLVYGATR